MVLHHFRSKHTLCVELGLLIILKKLLELTVVVQRIIEQGRLRIWARLLGLSLSRFFYLACIDVSSLRCRSVTFILVGSFILLVTLLLRVHSLFECFVLDALFAHYYLRLNK